MKILVCLIIAMLSCSTIYADGMGTLAWMSAMSASSSADEAKEKSEENSKKIDRVEKKIDLIMQFLGIGDK